MMLSVIQLALGAATAALGYGVFLIGRDQAATCAMLLLVLPALDRAVRLGGGPNRGGSALQPGLLFLGAALGLVTALTVLPRSGTEGVFAVAVAAITIAALGYAPNSAAAMKLRPTSEGAQPTLGRAIALLALGFFLATTLGITSATATRICGRDAASIVFATAPAFLVAGIGAAAGRYLLRRHLAVRESLAMYAALAIAILIALFRADSSDWLRHAKAIESPAATRNAYLYGVALLSLVVSGLPLFFGGALAASVGNDRAGLGLSLRTTSFAAIGVVVGLAVDSSSPLLPALSGLAAIVAAYLASNRGLARGILVVAAIAMTAVAIGDRNARPLLDGGFVLYDPVAQFDGSESASDTPQTDAAVAPRVEPTRDGRPERIADPPGWPFQSDLSHALIDLAAGMAPAGEIRLFGDEAPAMVAATGRDDVVPIEQETKVVPGARAVIVLPSVFANPMTRLTAFDRFLDRQLATIGTGGTLFIALDLSEVDPTHLSVVARMLRHRCGGVALLLHGRHAVFAGMPDIDVKVRDATRTAWLSMLAKVARPPLPALALSPGAVARLAANDTDLHDESILLCNGRKKLPHADPRRAAEQLRRLLALSDRYFDGIDDPASPATLRFDESRVRLELAAAILDDDARTEDRLLRILDVQGATDAPRLRIQRERARDRIARFLIERRETDGLDADLRYRLGRVLRGAGEVHGALDELTRVVELRPHQLDAVVDLAETYLEADAKGLAKVVHGVVLPSRRMPFILEKNLVGLEDSRLLARVEIARAESTLRDARQGEGEARARLLNDVLDRLKKGVALDPSVANSDRIYAETLHRLGSDGKALDAARRAVLADPFDPLARALVVALATDAKERTRAAAAVFMLDVDP